MPGLLGDALPWAYSQGDRAKRYLNGLLNDPMGTAQQAVGQFGDNANYLRDLLGSAFADPKSFQPTNQNALSSLVQGLQNGPMGFAPVGMTTWHGSPHTFDKFDSSKIGTGEGAQAYGHGIYTAESPAVAESYQKTLAKFAPSIDGQSILELHGDGKLTGALSAKFGLARPEAIEAANLLAESARTGTPLSQMISGKAKRAVELYGADGPAEAARLNTLGQRLAPIAPTGGTGNLYKVDIPDEHIAKMLDWDKPLNQQAETVQVGVKKAMIDRGISPSVADYILQNKTGRDALSTIGRGQYDARLLPPDGIAAAQTSALLRQQGIPGIRYLDSGSRGQGAGSSNFVVFPGEENALKILARNGQSVR